MNYSAARNSMVENQIRPNKINDKEILNLFKTIQKESFLPENKKKYAYYDEEIKLNEKRSYLSNLHLAQLLQLASFSFMDKVLHIGASTGYVTMIISKLVNKVYAVENDEKLFNLLKQNIDFFKMENVTPINNEYANGYDKEKPYDIIFIDSKIEFIPENIYNQLNEINSKFISIEKVNENLSKGFILIKDRENSYKEYEFDSMTESISLFKKSKNFKF